MNTGTRLGLYGGGLAVLFAAAFGTAALVAPDGAADDWNEQSGHDGGHGSGDGEAPAVGGLAIEQDGYLLSQVSAPAGIGEDGELAFQITGADGAPLTDYAVSHEKELHLIVVRTDGSHFRHVHPELGADGTWSLPWTWDAAGSYRVYADFVPEGGEDLTLTRTVEVAGDFGPQIAAGPSLSTEVDGFTVTLDGDLTAGAASEVTASVTRDGRPVEELEPYLGAFGHLVALREGDLAYLHVHPEGEAPQAGDLSGPAVEFATEVPTAGRYFLYFDFQVAGQVHSAAFVVDTAESAGGGQESEPSEGTTEAPTEEPSESDDHGTDGHGH
ncbi:heavy-metal-associated domain-containing protein [Glycomyces tritici]|uniref:Heavy-metal-associated domain-containing protein n=1 Tax=Glycomyces tritici TaxID=2665176 RepID=A0ABT7YTR3_9ACTN|nr:heavy-metal-associated domain-containing protein [Glycomyces tritici]MDN3242003.1 heavy-metal-associated domain-containing protein [Glycomyces tritici]